MVSQGIVQAIQVDDPWGRLNFCFLHLGELDGRMPIEAIREGDVEAAIRAARHYGDHGAS